MFSRNTQQNTAGVASGPDTISAELLCHDQHNVINRAARNINPTFHPLPHHLGGERGSGKDTTTTTTKREAKRYQQMVG
jgi:hypothetical protein